MVVREGRVEADHSATSPGRGAWVHPSPDCLETALTRKAFGRALREPDAVVDPDALRLAISHHPIQTPPGLQRERADQPSENEHRDELMSND